MDNYKILAEDYDLLNPKEEIFKQGPFLRKLIEQYKVESVLDCACGTGWHLHMLDEFGVNSSGSDLSPEMIKLAGKNLAGKNITLREGDFRELSNIWNEKFDMVICMTTSLPHMLTDEDAIKALNSMHEVLNPGGIVVINNGISDSLISAKHTFMPARIHEDVAFYFFFEYPNEDKMIFNILEVKKTPESFEHAYDKMEYNTMGIDKMRRYFSKTPFKKVDYYGDFEFSKYDKDTSRRLIVIAQK